MFSGYGIKYRGTQTSLENTTITIDIHEYGYVGDINTIDLAGDGIQITSGSKSSFLWDDVIYPTSIKCAIFDKDKSIRDDVMGKAFDRFRYVVKEGTTILSVGRLPIIDYSRPLYVADAVFNISGSNGLGDLQESPVETFAEVVASFKDWIVTALSYSGLGLDVEFATDWTPQLYKTVDRVIENVFYSRTHLDDRIAYEVIEQLAREWGCRVYQKNGRWRIEQLELQGNHTVHRYNSAGVYQTSYAENTHRVFSTESDLVKFIDKNGVYEELQSHKSANVNFSAQSELQSTGGIRNWQFHNWNNDNTRPLFWQLNNLTVSRLQIIGSEFVLMDSTWDMTNYMSQSGAKIYPGSVGRVTVTPRFLVATEDDDAAGEFVMRLMLKMGDWYLKQDGTWTETPTNIIISKAFRSGSDETETIKSNTLYSVSIISEGQDENGDPIVPTEGGDVELRIMPVEIINQKGAYEYTQWDEVILQFGESQLLSEAHKESGRLIHSAVPAVFSDFGYQVDSPLREVVVSGITLRRNATCWSRDDSVQTFDEISQQELLAESIIANIGHQRGRYIVDAWKGKGSDGEGVGLRAYFHEVLQINVTNYLPTYVQYVPKTGITELVLLDATFDFTSITVENTIGRVPDETRRSFKARGAPGGLFGGFSPEGIFYETSGLIQFIASHLPTSQPALTFIAEDIVPPISPEGGIENIRGLVSSLPVTPLRVYLREGLPLYVSSLNGTSGSVTVSEDVPTGSKVIPIKKQFVDFKVADPVYVDTAILMAYSLIQPDKIQQSVERERSGAGYTHTTTAINPGKIVSLTVKATPIAIEKDTLLEVVEKRSGETTLVIVSANVVQGAKSIPIKEKEFTTRQEIGSRVEIAASWLKGSIDILAGTVIIKAEAVGDTVTKMALIRLDASIEEGSAIKLSADNIDLEGKVTFSMFESNLQAEWDALSGDFESLGDMAFEDAVELAKLGTTVVQGGYLQTIIVKAELIEATALSAISANLGTVTAGSITGVTITGGTFRTAASGRRVQMTDANVGMIDFRGAGGDSKASLVLDAVDEYLLISASGLLRVTPRTVFEGDRVSFIELGDSKAPASLYTGVTNPTNTNRLNYDGNFHATALAEGGTSLSSKYGRWLGEWDNPPLGQYPKEVYKNAVSGHLYMYDGANWRQIS